MSINLITVRPAVIRVGTKPEPNRRKSWWVPLFGWTSEPNYFVPPENQPTKKKVENAAETNNESSVSDPSGQPANKKTRTRLLTEEKARRLRMLTADTMSFREVMYHSAIASRLASEFKHRPAPPESET